MICSLQRSPGSHSELRARHGACLSSNAWSSSRYNANNAWNFNGNNGYANNNNFYNTNQVVAAAN